MASLQSPPHPPDREPSPDSHQLPLLLMGAGLALALFVVSVFSIWHGSARTSQLTIITGYTITDDGAVALLMTGLFALYGFIFFVGQRYVQSFKSMKMVLWMSLICILVLVISPPFLSADIFGYIIRANIVNVHDVNPYLVSPTDLGYYDIVIWADQVMRYGPLYTSLSLGLNNLLGTSLAVNLIGFRLFNLIFLGAALFLIYKIAQKTAPRFRYAAVMLVAWNPFVLLEVVHSAHNDILVLCSLLASVFCLTRRKAGWAVVALTLGALVKFGPVVLIPLPIMVLLMRKQSWKKKVLTLAGACALSALLVFLLYLPYGAFQSNLSNLEGAFYYDDFLTLPKALVLTGLSLFTEDSPSGALVQNSYIVTFGLLCGAIFFMRFRDWSVETVIKRMFWIILFFLSLLSIKFNIWYLIWLLPLVLLVRSPAYHRLVLFVTFFGLAFYSAFGIFLASVIFFCCLTLYGIALWSNSWFNREKANPHS